MLILVPALVRYGHGGESVTHEAQFFFIFMHVCHLTHTLHVNETMKQGEFWFRDVNSFKFAAPEAPLLTE